MKTNVVLSSASGQDLSRLPSSSEAPTSSEEVVDNGPPPLLAVRSDGAVLLSIEDLGERDLTGLIVWTAVVLPAEHAAFAHRRVANAVQETAAHLGGRLPFKGPGRTS